MGYSEASRIIYAPVEIVWNTLNDIDNTPKWVVGLERAEVKTPGAYGHGTIYNDYNRIGPFLQVTPWYVTEFEPMSHQTHVSVSVNLPSKMKLSLSSTAEGTLLKMTVEFQFFPKWGAVGRLLEDVVMNHVFKSVLTQNLDRLNTYLQQTSMASQSVSNSI